MLAELMRLKWPSRLAARMARPHHQPDRLHAGGGASRSHRDQRRHHQCLRHQHRMGRRRVDVVEADESDGSFLRLPAVTRSLRTWIRNTRSLGHAGAMIAGYDQCRRQHSVLWFRRPVLDHPAVQQMIRGCRTGASLLTGFHRRPMCAPIRCARTSGLDVRGRGDRSCPRPLSPQWVRSGCR